MTYALPRRVRDELEILTTGLRNAERVLRLACFIARFHTGPRVRGRRFTLCRRALAEHPDLGMSEDQVRAAIEVLERVGFLVREAVTGSGYRRTPAGTRRAPVLRRVAEIFLALFSSPKKAAPPQVRLSPGILLGDQRLEAALARLGAALSLGSRPAASSGTGASP